MGPRARTYRCMHVLCMCVYVRVYVCVCVCLGPSVYACVYVRAIVCWSSRMDICACTYTRKCVHVCVHACVSVCVCVSAYIFACSDLFACLVYCPVQSRVIINCPGSTPLLDTNYRRVIRNNPSPTTKYTVITEVRSELRAYCYTDHPTHPKLWRLSNAIMQNYINMQGKYYIKQILLILYKEYTIDIANTPCRT